ncbi:MAG: DUF6497 family protein [Pseudomonadota bacterium]
MRAVLALLLLAAPAGAETLTLQMGESATLLERFQDPDGPAGPVVRYRFVAPGLAGLERALTVEEIAQEMDMLCATVVLPEVAAVPDLPDEVVITLMDRPVAFGTPAPDATQYFEAYRIVDGTCVWEGF